MFRTYGNEPFHIVVVHGGPGAVGTVAPVAREIGQTRGVLEPLQTAYTLEGQIEELRQVIEQNATTPVIFIGHSWGAWLCALVTAAYPDLVRKLILVSSGPFEDKYVPQIAENRLKRLRPREREEFLQIVDMLNGPTASEGADMALQRLGELAHKADCYDPIEIPNDTTDLSGLVDPGKMYQGVWPKAAALRETGELLRRVATIQCPVVAIHGDCDPHPAEGIRRPLAANLKDFHMIILDKCGHTPWEERHAQDTFYEILEREISASQ
ncbi:alpha/beta fold hydrolase [Dictyobacter formicarum]|uniref:Alpha/beta hydrolase n=1 Tax=Dictyobacter formicarum TaxID=2778368 RepID=A0ABQ3VJD7_9CHLR|nr:alpha/beta hydrolase [Dictyobacter formicarum]GHO85718.1 alpha/beta hydrolase [Dictyobacter formicarum]